jgi:phosphate transport system substrate-binding protein
MLFSIWTYAHADTAQPILMVQQDLGGMLADAIRAGSASAAGHVTSGGSAAACATQPAGMPRLVVVAGQPRKLEVEACRQNAASDVLAVTIGYQAVALVTPANAPVFRLRSADLFRAVAQHADDERPPTVWRDLNPDLPALGIGLLAPPAGSAAARLLNTYIMEPECTQMGGARLPFERDARIDYCGALRAAPTITRRKDGMSGLAAWAAASPAGQLAVVDLEELRRLDGAAVALPLDDVMPLTANIESGLYPASEKITLLIVMPHDTLQASRDAARRNAFDLLSEASIGPDGTLAHAGLVPLPPAERVAARSSAIAFVETP